MRGLSSEFCQCARSFSLAFRQLAAVAREILSARQRRSSTSSSQRQNKLTQFKANSVILCLNGVKIGNVSKIGEESTSNGIQPVARQLSIGFEISISRALKRLSRAPKTYSRYAALRKAQTAPSLLIPSARRRRKLRRKLMPHYL